MKVLFYKSSSGRNLILEYINKQDQVSNDNCLESISLLEKYGFSLPPKLLKKIKGVKKLWELRVLGKNQHRFFFTTQLSDTALILHGFVKKSQKTPKKELDKAISRMKNI